MKVLMATTYIYNKEWPEFTRNKTGLGIMVFDIYNSVSASEETRLITHVLTEGRGNGIIRHNRKDILRCIRLKDVPQAISWFLKYKQSFGMRLRFSYYVLNKGFVKRTIQEFSPDVVHVHGLGLATKTYMDVCEELHIPYVLTHHGLIGLDKSVHAPKWNRDFERDFLVRAEKENIPVTVISTGMKKRIEENYIGHEAKNIVVVTNGTKIQNDISDIVPNLDIRTKYGISNEEKICIVIGSVCERKNQIQIADAYAVSKWAKHHSHVFFCGNDATNGMIQSVINSNGLQERLHVLGFVTPDKLKQLIAQADINIVASRDEGFGLSIIETGIMGLPTVTFSDLDAVEDLYDEKTMITCESRNTQAFAECIDEALQKEWDRDYIKNYSKRFSLEKMAEQYEKEYTMIINGGVRQNS